MRPIDLGEDITAQEAAHARPYAIEAIRELGVALSENDRDDWIVTLTKAVAHGARTVSIQELDPDFYVDCPKCEAERRKTDLLDQRLDLVRRAILGLGYFEPGQVDDDLAPRITEFASEMRQERDALKAEVERAYSAAATHLAWAVNFDVLAPDRAVVPPGGLLRAIHALASKAKECRSREETAKAEVDRLNARWGSYGDITRPDWIDAPFTAAEHIPVLTAGGAEHLRSYAISQERIVRAQREEIEKWRGAASTLCGAHVGQKLAKCPACELEGLRAEYIDETTRFNRGWERARAGETWDAIEDEYEQMGWALFQQPKQTRKLASLQADLDTERGWLREARLEAEKLRAEVANLRTTISGKTFIAVEVCTVDVESLSWEWFGGEEDLRQQFLDDARNHTRRVSVEEVAGALELMPVTPGEHWWNDAARAAIRAIGAALAGKPEPTPFVVSDTVVIGAIVLAAPHLSAGDACTTARAAIAEIDRQRREHEAGGGK